MQFNAGVDPAGYDFAHRVRVRFCETDAMAVVHHASYLAYLEEARVEYLRDLGHPYDAVRRDGVEFPVLEVAVRYLRPLRFDDVVDVHTAIGPVSAATFQISYLLRTGDAPSATAVTVHASVNRDGRPLRTPAWLRSVARGA